MSTISITDLTSPSPIEVTQVVLKPHVATNEPPPKLKKSETKIEMAFSNTRVMKHQKLIEPSSAPERPDSRIAKAFSKIRPTPNKPNKNTNTKKPFVSVVSSTSVKTETVSDEILRIKWSNQWSDQKYSPSKSIVSVFFYFIG